MSDSGFEDVAFQSNLCTSGSLHGVMSGTHYNRAWIVHTGEMVMILIVIYILANKSHTLSKRNNVLKIIMYYISILSFKLGMLYMCIWIYIGSLYFVTGI